MPYINSPLADCPIGGQSLRAEGSTTLSCVSAGGETSAKNTTATLVNITPPRLGFGQNRSREQKFPNALKAGRTEASSLAGERYSARTMSHQLLTLLAIVDPIPR